MKICAMEWKDHHIIREHTVEDLSEDTRTHKIFRALDEICVVFDLPHPQWLDAAIRDFQKHARCRFTQDAFVGEDISFDYLELMVLEED
jgi:hypothetical protein